MVVLVWQYNTPAQVVKHRLQRSATNTAPAQQQCAASVPGATNCYSWHPR